VQESDALAITDEIYEHILYDARAYSRSCRSPACATATILVKQHEQNLLGDGLARGMGLSGTDLSDSIRKVPLPDVGAAAPLQQAGALAMTLPPGVFTTSSPPITRRRRNTTMAVLEARGFRCFHARFSVLHHDRIRLCFEK